MKNYFELKMKMQVIQNKNTNTVLGKKSSCTVLRFGLKQSYLFEKTLVKTSLILDVFVK